jgi:uncharacterized membrane protein YeaQ/YmgE (transglycosylase-associated protein family)
MAQVAPPLYSFSYDQQDRQGRKAVEGIVGIIIQLIAGAIGGNVAGSAVKNYSLGTTGNSIAGAVGGVILTQVLAAMGIGSPDMAAAVDPAAAGAATGGGLDIGALLTQLIGGGAGGAILTVIAGAIRGMMQK